MKGKRNISKLIALALTMGLLAGASAVGAYATEFNVEDTGNGVLSNGIKVAYDKTFEKMEYFDDNNGQLLYGFDNFLFNEDFCKSYHETSDHTAWVKNDKYKKQTTREHAGGAWTGEVSMGHGTKPVWGCSY